MCVCLNLECCVPLIKPVDVILIRLIVKLYKDIFNMGNECCAASQDVIIDTAEIDESNMKPESTV